MSHTYSCPHCGKRHSAQTLLFDLKALLDLKVLKLRLTASELAALAQAGKWKPSLSALMDIIANKNNLNDSAIAALTMAQIDEFLAACDANLGEDGNIHSRFESAAPMDETPDALAEYEMPPAIQALCGKMVHCVTNQLAERLVADDLRNIQALFAHTGPTYTFQLLQKTDASGGQVTTGVIVETQGHKHLMDTRVCPTCGEAVPEVACTIPQHLVTFIGDQATGKTSTLIALAHYAKNRSFNRDDDPIWGDTPAIDGVRMLELLDVSADLERDLEHFASGIVPPKTDIKRGDAYAVQLHSVDRDGQHSLLTLMDLPGELYNWAGHLNTEMLLNEFPAVLSSDVLVHCISDDIIVSPQNAIADVNCTASLLQLKSQFTPGTCPILTLYTKSDLDDDRRENDLLNKYRQILKQFDIPGYRAGMSCRGFGFHASTLHEIEFFGAAQRTPHPRNIHLVLQWLLAVTGCIDAESVNPITGERRTGRVTRPQDRSQNPLDQEEAIARCALFENPGQHDWAYLDVSTSFQRMMLKLRMSRQPNDA